MDERIQEMRLKLDKIAWEPDQLEKNKRAFDFIVMYADYLIQQAEKVQELEAENESLRTRRDHLAYRLKVRREENHRYREALEFYANEINYQVFIKNGKSNIEHDGGEKAGHALKGETNETSK